ncbi:glycosyltransferase family 2 protein [Flavobacterium rhamnosiphilum]|uniref:Glycosyltransferase family 2 protein n=1 Tax=Flavobacterium rhamnosiphilum TaxID=2541724 RepID=A0A4R5FB37_9FLAO|nr:glycosyltransferase family 2 protein [Flavobacterium rhamnosiphilum]TDE46041.1 glycosyltransferase family 2 protein [Flavobacterium rhamnosiphilum]
MSDNNLKILTIIITYNGSKWIKKCIDSLQISTISTAIFVVDNASSDDTVSILETFKDIKIYRSSENLGFGQANNLGLKYALDNKYNYVFLLNQDTWIEKNTIEVLSVVAEKNKEYGIISPMHYFSDEKSLEYFFSTRISPQYCKDILSDFVIKGVEKMEDIYPLNFINAACWLIPRKTLEIVGGFDPIFFHYGEDNNYCDRVNYHNMQVGIVPAVKIYHDCYNANNKKEQDIKEQLRKFELDAKTIYANINLDVSKRDILALAFKKLLFSLLFIFRFKFLEARKYWLSAKIIFKNCNKIIESRSRNFIPGENYLINENKS